MIEGHHRLDTTNAKPQPSALGILPLPHLLLLLVPLHLCFLLFSSFFSSSLLCLLLIPAPSFSSGRLHLLFWPCILLLCLLLLGTLSLL